MSHIQKRADRRYRARWLDPDGRERSRTFTRKADAERHLAAVEGAKLSGAYVSDANPVTVGEYARQWAATRPHRQTTATRVESLISKHIEGTTIGDKRLSAVRATEIQAWVTDRARVLSPTTVRLLVQTLRSVFNAACSRSPNRIEPSCAAEPSKIRKRADRPTDRGPGAGTR